MMGYMTVEQAKSYGFTHHGRYYGIPLWVGFTEDDMPIVATKWAPLEPVMTVLHFVEGVVRAIAFPNDPPCFQFQVGDQIDE